MERKHFNKSFFLLVATIVLFALSINAQSIKKVTGNRAGVKIEIKDKNKYFLLPKDYNIEIVFDVNPGSLMFEPTIRYNTLDTNIIEISSSVLLEDKEFSITSLSNSYKFFVIDTLSIKILSLQNDRNLGQPVQLKIGPFKSQPTEISIKSSKGKSETTKLVPEGKDYKFEAIFFGQPDISNLVIYPKNTDEPTFLIRNKNLNENYFEAVNYSEISFTGYSSDIKNFNNTKHIFLQLESSPSYTISHIMINDKMKLSGITPLDTSNVTAKLICENIKRKLMDLDSITIFSSPNGYPIGTIKQDNLGVKTILANSKSENPFVMIGSDKAYLRLQIFDSKEIKFESDPTTVQPGETFTLTGKENFYPSAVSPIIMNIKVPINPEPNGTGSNIYKFKIPEKIPVGEYGIYLKSKYSEYQIHSEKKIKIVEFSEEVSVDSFVTLNIPGKNIDTLKKEPIDIAELQKIQLNIKTDKIGLNKGPQFIIVKITTTTKEGLSSDTTMKFSVFNEEDERGSGLNSPYLRACIEKKDYKRLTTGEYPIGIKDLKPWSKIKIEIHPDRAHFTDDGTDISTNTIVQNFKVKGPSFKFAFSSGLPWVLVSSPMFNSSDDSGIDSLKYGSVSLFLKFFPLNEETGKKGWLSLGIGFYGIDPSVLKVAESGKIKLDNGGLILPQLSINLLQLFTEVFRIEEVPQIFDVAIDFSIFIPFNYPYTRGLISLSASFTP